MKTPLGTDGGVKTSSGSFEGVVDIERDRELVERCQQGDVEAFEALYLQYRQRLQRFCLRRLHEPHEAEDVVQETFARAWRSLPDFAGDRRFYPWLTVIAGNLCTDLVRRRTRVTPLDEPAIQARDAGTYDTEDAVLHGVDVAMVTTAFGKLKPRHQRVLDLRERSGWSYQRIADEEGVGISTVETLLWRARQALKREFSLLDDVDGKTGALIGVLAIIPRKLLYRIPSSIRHVINACRHVACALTPNGVSVAASGVVLVGMGSVFLAPAPPPLATPVTRSPAITSVAPTTPSPALVDHGSASTGTGTSSAVPSTPPVQTTQAPQPPAPLNGTTASSGGSGGSGLGGSIGGGSLPAEVGGALGGAASGAGSAVGGAASGATGSVGGAVSSAGSNIGGTLSSPAGNAVTGLTSSVGSDLTSAGSDLNTIVTGLTSGAGGVGGLLGGQQG